ncbi:hypothetical protein IQ251_18250 [Saccharopolyspora sp. HNM0983]|uniref:Uncharacterized protein n=1 Tax=Saccharopolyspora montiporae TaxID=2781240 RepID=A0A929BAP3_9PSEU|nr:hypothetical protein [Saccharopolyspora sp. HNM0983]MBE9376397.1 hypothetical protein [Saccharopolyspora sp. HNM0983]
MPLNTEVEGDPAGIRASARWLSQVTQRIDTAGTRGHQASSSSEPTWTSSAGDSFRGGMSRVGPEIDEVSTDHTAMCRELNEHADNLDTVKQRIAQARQHASEAGLTVHGNRIMEPGPEPTPPTPLPSDEPATPEQQRTYAAGTQAQAAYARKVQAYQECSQTIDDARKLENSSLAVLNRFISGVAEKSPFNIADAMTGLAGATAAQSSAFRTAAATIAESGKLERAGSLMHSPYLSLQHQTRAAAIHARNSVNMAESTRKATATRTAQFVDRLGPKTKSLLQRNLNFGVRPEQAGNKLLRGSLKVGSKLPVAGLVITGAGIGYDVGIAEKDPTTSVASGLGGYAAGAATGALVFAAGGPVGWAIGLGVVASVGAGFAIEEWGDDVAGAVGDAAGAVGDWAGDLF